MLKKLYSLAVFYAILGLAGGVFYREFTKFSGFTGATALGVVHTHALVLGLLFFLVALLLEKQFAFVAGRMGGWFLGCYNGGLLVTLVMLVVRGVLQVGGAALSKGADAAVSGIAGLGHILLGAGLVLFLLLLKNAVNAHRQPEEKAGAAAK